LPFTVYFFSSLPEKLPAMPDSYDYHTKKAPVYSQTTIFQAMLWPSSICLAIGTGLNLLSREFRFTRFMAIITFI